MGNGTELQSPTEITVRLGEAHLKSLGNKLKVVTATVAQRDRGAGLRVPRVEGHKQEMPVRAE